MTGYHAYIETSIGHGSYGLYSTIVKKLGQPSKSTLSKFFRPKTTPLFPKADYRDRQRCLAAAKAPLQLWHLLQYHFQIRTASFLHSHVSIVLTQVRSPKLYCFGEPCASNGKFFAKPDQLTKHYETTKHINIPPYRVVPALQHISRADLSPQGRILVLSKGPW